MFYECGQLCNPNAHVCHQAAAAATAHLQLVMMKGHLFKLQNNQREYNRRWFVLERGVMSYFDNDKVSVPLTVTDGCTWVAVTSTYLPYLMI